MWTQVFGTRLWDAMALVVPGFAEAHDAALQVLAQLLQQERPIHRAVQHLTAPRAMTSKSGPHSPDMDGARAIKHPPN